MKSLPSQMKEALAGLPASDRAELLAEVRRHLRNGTAPARPTGRDAEPAFDLPAWRGKRTAEIASPAEARWRLVSAMLAFDAGRTLAYCQAFAIARRTAAFFAAPGRMLWEMLSVVYPGTAGDRCAAILSPLPIAAADSIAHDVLRCFYAEAVPGMPAGAAPSAVDRWRVDIADALLCSNLDAASDCVRRAPHDLSTAEWRPLSAIPFRKEEEA